MIFFFDLDGVIIDSAKECYLISKLVYYNDKEFTYEENLYSKLFYKHRGLVGNAGGFQILHTLIEKKMWMFCHIFPWIAFSTFVKSRLQTWLHPSIGKSQVF